jgi:hypothetical protein
LDPDPELMIRRKANKKLLTEKKEQKKQYQKKKKRKDEQEASSLEKTDNENNNPPQMAGTKKQKKKKLSNESNTAEDSKAKKKKKNTYENNASEPNEEEATNKEPNGLEYSESTYKRKRSNQKPSLVEKKENKKAKTNVDVLNASTTGLSSSVQTAPMSVPNTQILLPSNPLNIYSKTIGMGPTGIPESMIPTKKINPPVPRPPPITVPPPGP